ncbi:MAG: DNA (cytosine-5-)-methyltransferase [Pyrinomonadaceae bacterium]
MSEQKTFLEFFAGIGLVHLGLRRSGWECIYANDISKKKEEIYRDEFPDATYFHCEDIWKTDDVVCRITERAALATASFPCIDLSLAGQMRGLEGKHSGTLFGFIEAMHRLKSHGLMPPVVMLENVVGLIAGKDGDDFRKTCRAVAELGYYLDAVAVDAKHFVPQSRPRLFIIGTLLENIPPDVLTGEDWIAEMSHRNGAVGKKLYDAMRTTEIPTGWVAHRIPSLPPIKNNVASFIDTDDDQKWWSKKEVEKHLNRTSGTHYAELERLRRSGETWVGTAFRRIREGTTRVEVRFDGIAGCLRTANGGSARQIVVLIRDRKLKMRWMTPREYARLQGAPEFNIQRGINQSLTGFGDGVCVQVVEWVDANILSPIYNHADAPRHKPLRPASQAQLSLG